MRKHVIIDEVFGDDILDLENVVNDFVNDEKHKEYKVVSITTHDYSSRGKEFMGARITLLNIEL